MPPFLTVLFLAVAALGAGGGAYVYVEARNLRRVQDREEKEVRRLEARAKQASIDSFRMALAREIRDKRKRFVFSEFVATRDVPRDDADQVAMELFRKLAEKVVEDGIITDDERQRLDTFAGLLEIGHESAVRVEWNARDDRYRSAVSTALSGGQVGEAEARVLKALRESLEIDEARSRVLVGAVSCEAYLLAFRRVALDGRITPEEREELARYREALAISDLDAAATIRHEALALYRRRFAEVVQDGDVSPEDERDLDWLQRETGLLDADLSPYLRELAEVKRLADLRRGNLPAVQTTKLLEGGETCYWDGPCLHSYRTPTKDKSASGELVVTSKRIMFVGPEKNFTFAPSKILDIAFHGEVLQIKATGKNGSGGYRVPRPAELEAILVGLAKKHKYLLGENYSSTNSRHIPDSVKREVWDRDGGHCIRCSAADYLEFDHIIPHARGGANTVGNVQLLCRRCNGEKSDRI